MLLLFSETKPNIPIKTTAASATNQTTTITFAAKADMSMSLGTYSATAQITVIGNDIPAPTITTVSPNTGVASGGTEITITGTDLDTAYQVFIDLDGDGTQDSGEECASANILSATSITCATPVGTVGVKNVVVKTCGGTGTKTGGFTYIVSPPPTHNFCTEPAYTTPPTGAPYDNAVMPLRHPQVGDMLDTGDTVYFNIPDDARDTLSYVPSVSYAVVSANDEHAYIDGGVVVDGDGHHEYYVEIASGSTFDWTYYKYDTLPGGSNPTTYTIPEDWPPVINIDCDNPLMQYIWVDPWEVEYRNIQIGDDLQFFGNNKGIYFNAYDGWQNDISDNDPITTSVNIINDESDSTHSYVWTFAFAGLLKSLTTSSGYFVTATLDGEWTCLENDAFSGIIPGCKGVGHMVSDNTEMSGIDIVYYINTNSSIYKQLKVKISDMP
jgi:hypothetical protein